jgi:hypothetical protein
MGRTKLTWWKTDVFCEEYEELVSPFRKNRSRVKFSIRQNNLSIWDTLVFRTTVLLGTKHHEVFSSSLFLETEVFPQYFKKIELTNGALFAHASGGLLASRNISFLPGRRSHACIIVSWRYIISLFSSLVLQLLWF